MEFGHISKNLTEFKSSLNLSGGIYYKKRSGITEQQFAEDVAEMIAHHAITIWPTLKSFSGYDCIRFVNVNKRKKKK